MRGIACLRTGFKKGAACVAPFGFKLSLYEDALARAFLCGLYDSV
jgi:hypothetical protein